MSPLHDKAQSIYERLVAIYGTPAWGSDLSPLEELIATILSANTNDTNSGRAFNQLMAAFGGDWDAVRRAPLPVLMDIIRPAGLQAQKAGAIVGTLEKLHDERGVYNLDPVATMPVDAALAYLMSFPGVGRKTASIVLLFCFGAPAFPVDTHIARISQRLGISSRRAAPEKIMLRWEELLPPSAYPALHIDLIRHGRQVCTARDPRCELCPLQPLCDYAGRVGDWAPHGAPMPGHSLAP